MKPGPFGHEHPADRAQAILWDYDSYGRLPRHVNALDVGAFTEPIEQLISVAPAREFFVLTQWTEGSQLSSRSGTIGQRWKAPDSRIESGR